MFRWYVSITKVFNLHRLKDRSKIVKDKSRLKKEILEREYCAKNALSTFKDFGRRFEELKSDNWDKHIKALKKEARKSNADHDDDFKLDLDEVFDAAAATEQGRGLPMLENADSTMELPELA